MVETKRLGQVAGVAGSQVIMIVELRDLERCWGIIKSAYHEKMWAAVDGGKTKRARVEEV